MAIFEKVVDYDIIHDRNYEALIRKVKSKVQQGWRPKGGSYVLKNILKGDTPEEIYQSVEKVEYVIINEEDIKK